VTKVSEYIIAMMVLMARIVAKKLNIKNNHQTMVQPFKLYGSYKVPCTQLQHS